MLADKFGKALVSKIGTAASISAPIILIVSLLHVGYAPPKPSTHSSDDDTLVWKGNGYSLFLIGMIVDGFVYGILGGPIQALFADSVGRGQRSVAYNMLYGSYLIGDMVGPLLTVVYLYHRGSGCGKGNLHPECSSDTYVLTEIIMIGLAVSIIPPVLILFFITEPKHKNRKKKREKEGSIISHVVTDDETQILLYDVQQHEGQGNLLDHGNDYKGEEKGHEKESKGRQHNTKETKTSTREAEATEERSTQAEPNTGKRSDAPRK